MAIVVVGLALIALSHQRPERPPAPAAGAPLQLAPQARRLRDGRRIDLNGASAADLELLPRVGPAIAARILSEKPFGSVDELIRVRGIGAKTLERLRPWVCVGGDCVPLDSGPN